MLMDGHMCYMLHSAAPTSTPVQWQLHRGGSNSSTPLLLWHASLFPFSTPFPSTIVCTRQ
jgi:hypothetical protein